MEILVLFRAPVKEPLQEEWEPGPYPGVSLEPQTLDFNTPLEHTHYTCQQSLDFWKDSIYYHILIPLTV